MMQENEEFLPVFPSMRRNLQQLPQKEAKEILHRNTSGVLALSGTAACPYPYAVPLSYAYDGEQTIVFHCAKTGDKMERLYADAHASFCVIDADDVVPDAFSTRYRSVIVFGTIKKAEDPAEILAGLQLLADKYAPLQLVPKALRDKEIAGGISRLNLLVFHIDHMTGKESRALAAERSQNAT